MKYDIKTLEGAAHKLTVIITGEQDFSGYTVYGACVSSCGCKCYHFEVIEKSDNECSLLIPALKYGIYKYQLFAKQISNNEEDLLIEGYIIADDRYCDGYDNGTNTSVVSTQISSDTVELSVSVQYVAQGDDGGYYIPSVSADGNLSWTATESDMPTVATVNIRGPQGPAGEFDTSILDEYATIAYVDEAVEGAGGGSSSFDMAAYNAFYGKYYNCTTRAEAYAINKDYENDLTYNGEWVYGLGNLTSGAQFFRWGGGNLRSFRVDLPKLTSGNHMFNYCGQLTSFEGDLPAMTNGNSMFSGCTSLRSFRVDLPALTSGTYMFSGCSSLRSFEGDLSALTSGHSMFRYCSSLRSFRGDLSALTSGDKMFYECILDKESVKRIADTINTIQSNQQSDTYLVLGLGSDISNGQTVTDAEVQGYIEQIEDKGWTVFINRDSPNTYY